MYKTFPGKYLILFMVLLCIGINTMHAQTYNFAASMGTFTPIVGGTSINEIEADENPSGNIPIGFPFTYFGNSHTQLLAHSNGFLTFDLGSPPPALTSNNIAHSGYFDIVAPLWDDLDGHNREASYITTGTAPNRVFTIEWLNWEWDFDVNVPVISFQVKFYETSNRIEFIYRQEANSAVFPSASIGLVGDDLGEFYSLADVSANPVLDPAGYNNIDAKPATGQIYSFSPVTLGAPTVQASNVIATPFGPNEMLVEWTNGNGSLRAVFMKQTSSVSETVVVADGTNYVDSNVFGNEPVGSGWYCVYDGPGSTVVVSNLQPNMSYRIQAVEYNGSGGTSTYNMSTAVNNPVTATLSLAPGGTASLVAGLWTNNNRMVIDLGEGDGARRAIFMKAGNSGTAPVADNTTYTANTVFGSGTQIGTSGWYCVFDGPNSPPFQITGLSANTEYRIQVVDYNGTTGAEKYNTTPSDPIQFTTLRTPLLSNYNFTSQSNILYAPITGGTDVDAIEVDEGYSGSIPLGFTFFLEGVPFTEVAASSDGFLTFNQFYKIYDGSGLGATNNLDIGGLRPLVAPLWDDLSGTGGTASYITTGTAPNRIFTFEWLNWRWGAAAVSAGISFQARLYEADGRIEFVYRQQIAGALTSPSASIGVSFQSPGTGNFISVDISGLNPTASTSVEIDNIGVKPATGQLYRFAPVRQSQTITFDGPGVKTLGDQPFTVNATATSSLPVSFTTPSNKITIEGNQITMYKAGSVTIFAEQEGSGEYAPAFPVERTFCINPPKPAITTRDLDTEAPVLTSSSASGNQWYKNGLAINGETGTTLTISEPGTYSVVVTIDGCSSVRSDDEVFIVTDIEKDSLKLRLFPNPVEDYLFVDVSSLGKPAEISIYDATGRNMDTVIGEGVVQMNMTSRKSGIYFVKIFNEKQIPVIKKIIKK